MLRLLEKSQLSLSSCQIFFYSGRTKPSSSRRGSGNQKRTCKADKNPATHAGILIDHWWLFHASQMWRDQSSDLTTKWYLTMWNDSQICWKLSKAVQREYSGVSISAWFTLGSNKWSQRKKGEEALPHYGEQLLILCQNIFKIWTAPSFLWCAALSMGLVTGGVKATREAPFISLSDMLSVMLQRGSILIVWTDHSGERGFDLGCWQNRHRLAELLLYLTYHYWRCIDRDGLFTSDWIWANGQMLSSLSQKILWEFQPWLKPFSHFCSFSFCGDNPH